MADTFNDNLKTIGDKYDETCDDWHNSKDHTDDAKKRGVRAATDYAETLLAEDDRAFQAAIDEEREALTGVLEAGYQHFGPKHGPQAVASMMGAQAAVSSADPRVILDAHEAALRDGDEAALSILETAGPAAMPTDALRKDFKDKVVAAKEERKHPVIKEREAALADFEARAESASYARAMLRSNLVQRIRSRKGPGA